MNWKDITVAQFERLQKAFQIEDETEKTIEIATIVYGESVIDLPYKQWVKKVQDLDFLSRDIPKEITKRSYTVNKHKYNFTYDPSLFTTAQYVDYTSIIKQPEFKISDVCSVFLIPEGHKYNDGEYDLNDVRADLQSLSIVDATSIAFFFKMWLINYIKTLKFSSLWKISKMNIDPSLKKVILTSIITNSHSLESFLTF